MRAATTRRPRLTILAKLIVAFVLPTLALFAVFGLIAYEMERRDLEAELGRRLEDIASAAATRIRGKYLEPLRPGDEQHLRYIAVQRRLEELLAATDVDRLYIFDRRFRSRADTDEAPIGTKYFQAEIDRREIERVFERAEPASSLLFEGQGGELFKAGYAPVFADEDDRRVVLAIGVDAPADFFARLARLRRSLIYYGLLLAVAVSLIAVFVAARITRPVRHLADAARRIGGGDLERPVHRTSRDEIGILADTMEAMRADLRARDERMQLMLSGIAHEVRNPLGGMELFTGILRDELADDPERLAHVQRIAKELGHLESVVASFLDYARRPAPEMAALDLAELCREVAELCAGDAAAAGVELSCRVEPAPVRGDPDQLRRALLNLVKNAIQAAAAAPEGQVRLRAQASGERAVAAVENSGPPIPEEVRPRLFEPFFTTREQGTGLGLAFVAEIAGDHGGTIELESGDGGTSFALSLPRGE